MPGTNGITSTAMYCVGLGRSNVKGARQSYRVASLVYSKEKGDGMLAEYSRGGEFTMRKKQVALLAAICLLAGALGLTAPALAQSKKESSSMPKVGNMAPDFSLKYFDGTDLKEVKLSDYRGKKNVVLAFYIFAFMGG
jgi:AhpC/TSA family